ncbi:hypothetical protein BDW62DRAFT_173320 [Aspergillus aurantiobrunneus]
MMIPRHCSLSTKLQNVVYSSLWITICIRIASGTLLLWQFLHAWKDRQMARVVWMILKTHREFGTRKGLGPVNTVYLLASLK